MKDQVEAMLDAAEEGDRKKLLALSQLAQEGADLAGAEGLGDPEAAHVRAARDRVQGYAAEAVRAMMARGRGPALESQEADLTEWLREAVEEGATLEEAAGWLEEARAKGPERNVGDKWPSEKNENKWFTKRADGRVVPTPNPHKKGKAGKAAGGKKDEGGEPAAGKGKPEPKPKAAKPTVDEVHAHVERLAKEGATPEGLETLAGHLQALTVPQLTELQVRLEAKLKGRPPKADRVEALKERARQLAKERGGKGKDDKGSGKDEGKVEPRKDEKKPEGERPVKKDEPSARPKPLSPQALLDRLESDEPLTGDDRTGALLALADASPARLHGIYQRLGLDPIELYEPGGPHVKAARLLSSLDQARKTEENIKSAMASGEPDEAAVLRIKAGLEGVTSKRAAMIAGRLGIPIESPYTAGAFIVGHLRRMVDAARDDRELGPVRSEAEWKDHPVFKAIGADKVHIEAPTSDRGVRRHLRDLSLVPVGLAEAVGKFGARLHVGDKGVPEMDHLERLKGVRPRGWAENDTWDVVGGMYDGAKRQVVAGRGRSGSVGTALHELGHAVAHMTQLDRHHELLILHRRYYDRLPSYLRQDGPGGHAGMEETFAEVFAHTIKDRDGAAKKYGDELVKWIEQKAITPYQQASNP